MAIIEVGDGIQPVLYIGGNKPAKPVNAYLLNEDRTYILTENNNRIIISYGVLEPRGIGTFAVSGSWQPGDML